MTTTGLFFDTRRPLQDGKFPLKLRITQNRKSRLYTIEINNQKLSLTPDEYDKISLIKPQLHFKELKKNINKIIEDADAIITSIDDFTFEKFEQIYKKKTLKTVKDYFDDYSQALLKNKNVRTANLYDACYNSLTTYNSSLVDFRQITPKFLNEYQVYMVKKGRSLTTVGMYLRNLRAMVNRALIDGLIKQSEYPFVKGKYVIPKGSSNKKILNQTQISRIYHCKGLNPLQEKARDFWIFSYLANGMNMIDILLLRYKNVDRDKFLFVRHKTKNTTISTPKLIKVIITRPLKQIITKWGDPDKSPDNFIFPVLSREPITKEDIAQVENFIRFVNQHMKSITDKLRLPAISTYTARHSYASAMIDNNANLVDVADNMGHTTMEQAKTYVQSINEKKKRKFAKIISKL